MLIIREAEVINLIEKIIEHYHTNICNRFSRHAILQLYLDDRTWTNLENFTKKLDTNRQNGFPLDELYRQVAACGCLAESGRNNVETLKSKIKASASSQDKVYRDISANNLPTNFTIFTDLLRTLFSMLLKIDNQKSGSNPPVYTQIRDLEHIRGFLTNYA